MVMGYVSSNWIWPRDWITSTGYTINDISSGDGYVYRATTTGTSGATRPNWSSETDSDGTVFWQFYIVNRILVVPQTLLLTIVIFVSLMMT